MILHNGYIFTKDECFELVNGITEWSVAGLKKSNTSDLVTYNYYKRNSYIAADTIPATNSIYIKLNDILKSIGVEFKKELINFNIIKYETGHFIATHNDLDPSLPNRFCAVVIQLSNSNDYTGGDFKYHLNDDTFVLGRELGYGIIFTPDVLHEVTQVLSGNRYSFVLWIEASDIQSIKPKSLI